ncbi:MAG: hypothetical protein JWM95_1377 [Gemmatimonadetes bacterium]|nr:hypothetical protein [Gemmatimonadota bacterium]
MTEVAADEARAAKLAVLRRATIQLVVGVVLLDALALACYYGFNIAHAVRKTQMTFTVAWTVMTALTVAFLLKRVRAARFR